MANPTIEISKQQVMSALLQLKPQELKNVLNDLFKQKLVAPPSLREIAKEASSIVKSKSVGPEVIEEAIKCSPLTMHPLFQMPDLAVTQAEYRDACRKF